MGFDTHPVAIWLWVQKLLWTCLRNHTDAWNQTKFVWDQHVQGKWPLLLCYGSCPIIIFLKFAKRSGDGKNLDPLLEGWKFKCGLGILYVWNYITSKSFRTMFLDNKNNWTEYIKFSLQFKIHVMFTSCPLYQSSRSHITVALFSGMVPWRGQGTIFSAGIQLWMAV